MQFILSNDTLEGSQALLSRLLAELESGKRVLWIVSGGSNITASVTVMKQIPSRVQAGLTILLSDERYGPSGHPDSNFQQLLDSGLAVAGARLIPTLQDGLDLAATAAAYATTLQAEFSKAEVIISQLGIGADGHIAGALPASPATTSSDWVVGYPSGPYERITMTFEALSQITADYSLVFGDDKAEALGRLQRDELPLAEQPAQILRHLPEAYIYNNQVGDTL